MILHKSWLYENNWACGKDVTFTARSAKIIMSYRFFGVKYESPLCNNPWCNSNATNSLIIIVIVVVVIIIIIEIVTRNKQMSRLETWRILIAINARVE